MRSRFPTILWGAIVAAGFVVVYCLLGAESALPPGGRHQTPDAPGDEDPMGVQHAATQDALRQEIGAANGDVVGSVQVRSTITILGRVVAAGRAPVAGAHVQASNDNRAQMSATTGVEGTFSLCVSNALGRRDLELILSAPRCTSTIVPIQAPVPSGPGDSTLDVGELVLLPGAAIVGRIVAPDGSPIVGARVLIDSLELPQASADRARRRAVPVGAQRWPVAVSRDDGGFVLAGIPLKKTRLVVTASGYLATYSQIVDITTADDYRIEEIVLEPLAPDEALRGVVLNPLGGRAAGAYVHCGDGTWSQDTVSDAQGSFILPLNGAIQLDVAAFDAEHSSFCWLSNVTPGADLVVQLRAMPDVPVTIHDPSGIRIDDAIVEVSIEGKVRARIQGRGDPLRVRIPQASIAVMAVAAGYEAAKQEGLDGLTVHKLQFVLEPRSINSPQSASVQPVWTEEDTIVERSPGTFRGILDVDGAAPDGVWTIDLGWRATKAESGPLVRLQLDNRGQFEWVSGEIGEHQLRATVVGGSFDGVVYFDQFDISNRSRSWARSLRTARLRVEGSVPRGAVAVWIGTDRNWAVQRLSGAADLLMFEGDVRVTAAIGKDQQKTPPSAWPALASGTARHDELLVLRVHE